MMISTQSVIMTEKKTMVTFWSAFNHTCYEKTTYSTYMYHNMVLREKQSTQDIYISQYNKVINVTWNNTYKHNCTPLLYLSKYHSERMTTNKGNSIDHVYISNML